MMVSVNKVVANALEYAGRTAKNGRVTEIDGVPYKPFKKGDKVVDRKGRKGTVTGFGIGGARLNFVVRFATGEEEVFAGEIRHVANSVARNGIDLSEKVRMRLYTLMCEIHHPDESQLPGTIARGIRARKWDLEHIYGVKNLVASKRSKKGTCEYNGKIISAETY